MRGVLQCLTGVVWLASLTNGLAVVRYVPTGGTPVYPTIQAAVSASLLGDTVLVQPGVYQESITCGSVDITLTSINPSDSNVVQATVIQGNSTNSVVTFSEGQTTKTLFTGFTVRAGGGKMSPSYQAGGGIYCDNCSPSIVGNIIEENHAVDFTSFASFGGAIACWGGSPRIARNIIRNNSAIHGGAIDSRWGSPLIEDNWIYNNTTIYGIGGAVLLSDEGAFINNTLVENSPNSLEVVSTRLVANNIIINSNLTGAIDVSLSWFKNNDVWIKGGTEILPGAGTNGNFSCDPLFVDAMNFDLRLSAASPCINAGDVLGMRSTNELDFDGNSRVFALRVDVGASEFCGTKNFAPMANAGPDREAFWLPGLMVPLDCSASIDPEGAPLTFSWSQIAGPMVTFQGTNNQTYFSPPVPEKYRFRLVAKDGLNESTPAIVTINVTCPPPIASAGQGQTLAVVPEVVVLDGSHSLDREGQILYYQWRQVSGPTVELTNALSARPSFRPPGPGTYEFELIVKNQFSTSAPNRVTFYLGQTAPVANAGPTCYVFIRNQITLDGSGSFAPNNAAPLEYAWRQISGPAAYLSATNVAKLNMRAPASLQELVFELVVKAGGLSSAPSTVRVVVLNTPKNSALSLITTFSTNRPTMVIFSGGNCDSGDAYWPPWEWFNAVNIFTCQYTRDPTSDSGDPRYYGYGDQLIVLLSALAPNYTQPIQTLGWSTGCMPACDVAERLNIFYKDPRYLVNRITFLDSGCGRDYNANISNLNSNRIPGKVFWFDNNYVGMGRFRPGTLNVQFPAERAAHSTPIFWYFPSWILGNAYHTTNFNNGVFGGSFFSVGGPGKNYQLETSKSEYYFGWKPDVTAFPATNLVQIKPTVYPARLPGAVELIGPTNAALVPEGNVVFSCEPVVNAVRYQLLVGADTSRVDQVAWEGTSPPSQPLPRLPFNTTYWTIRATDAYGSFSWADPRYVQRDCDADGLSDESEVITYHTDPDNSDTDGDGHLDNQEVLARTNPLQPNVGFQLAFQFLPPNQLQLHWFSDSGSTYDLESSTTMDSNSWQRVETFVAPATPELMQYVIPLPAEAVRFYRVKSYGVADSQFSSH